MCAEKKYGSKDDVGKFIEKICAGKGPATSGATVSCLNAGPEQSMKINDWKINRSIDDNRLITVD